MGLRPEPLSGELNALRRAVLTRLARSHGFAIDPNRIRGWIETKSDRAVWRQIELYNTGLRGFVRRLWMRLRPGRRR